MLMYTSCGWFFDELSGLETVQVIHYAGRAVELAKEFLGEEIEPQFLERLRLAKSNIARTWRWRANLRKVGEARGGKYRKAGRPLRHQFAV